MIAFRLIGRRRVALVAAARMGFRLLRIGPFLACVAGLLMAACAGDQVQPRQAPAIATPQPGVIYLDRCTWEHDPTKRVRTKTSSFVLYDDGTLLIEVNSGPYEDSWVEKRAADFGVQLLDRFTTSRGHREQRYEVDNLQAVRDLTVGARAQGWISETRDGIPVEYGFLAEVLESVPIEHRTLGQITAIPVRSTWLKHGAEPERITTVFFDAQNGEVVRSVSGIVTGRRDVCDRIKTDYQAKRPAGIKPPRLGISYLAKCDGSHFSNRASEETITFRVVRGDTLRIETVSDERISWVEKRLADHGVDIADRSQRHYEGPRKQLHRLSGLERVRKLIPGARAEGRIREYEAGNWFEYDAVVEVLDRRLINHAGLRDIYAIPVETRRRWVSGGETGRYLSYIDVHTGEIVRFESRSGQEGFRSCDLMPPESSATLG